MLNLLCKMQKFLINGLSSILSGIAKNALLWSGLSTGRSCVLNDFFYHLRIKQRGGITKIVSLTIGDFP